MQQRSPEPVSGDPSPPHLLLVDDLPANLHTLAAALQDDHALSVATSGQRALELAEASRPDLVLLDVMMPRMSGYEVCQAVAAQPDLRDVAIILLTAKGQEVDREQGLKLGALQYMTKPFDPDDILEMARDLLKL